MKSDDVCPRHRKSIENRSVDIPASVLLPEARAWETNVQVIGAIVRQCSDCSREGREPELVDGPIIVDHLARISKLGRPFVTTTYPRLRVTLDYRPVSGARAEDSKSVFSDESTQSRGIVPAEVPRLTLDSLIIDSSTRKAIDRALSRLKNHQLIYEEWGAREIEQRSAGLAVNIFGPPGTGKSAAAEAIAHGLGKKLLRVAYASLESKYVGDTPKNIVAAFEEAATQNALLLFDEADSILGRRLDSVSQSADHAVNVARSTMLMLLERFEGVVVFTTNKFSNYDEAFMRRIAEHIEMPLPSARARETLFGRYIPPRAPREADLDLSEIVQASEGLSGGEIREVVASAIAGFAVDFRRDASARFGARDLMSSLSSFKDAKTACGGTPSSAYTLPERQSATSGSR